MFHTRDPYFLANPGKLPQRGHAKQVYVFYNFEAPLRTGEDLKAFSDVFNLTMTYRRDSDIPEPSWGVVEKRNPKGYQPPTLKKVRQKKRTAVWFISGCEKDGSRRWEYAMELAKHIDLDIYGACGNLSCPKSKTDRSITRKCFGEVDRTHRFYLAFENAFCKDYVTEKPIIAFHTSMIPVLLGALPYHKILPPLAAIDVADFVGPRALAKHLNYLTENDEEYLKYFEFRKRYKIVGRGCSRGFCRLCQILHDPNYPYRSNFNAYDWWVRDARCLDRKQADRKLGLRVA